MVDRSMLSNGPMADESIPSMILRLAPLFMVSVADFVRYALNVDGAIQIVTTRIEALWRLAELAGWEATSIEGRKVEPTSAGFLVYDREVPHEWIDLSRRRVAPAVLAADEIPYHRMPWHFNPIECDLASGEVLVDCCPRCGITLGWTNVVSVFVCGACDFDVRENRPAYVPSDRLAMARDLHAYLERAADPLPPELDALDDISKAYAMEWLAFFVDLPIGRHLKPSCNNASMGLVEAKRWPDCFDDVMERFSATAPFVPGRAAKAQMIAQLTGAIQRAGTPPLRQLFVDRAIRVLGNSTLSDVVASDRIFGTRRDIRASKQPQSYPLSLGEVLRMDSMRAIQSVTSRRPLGS
jgi:hypothetical protein